MSIGPLPEREAQDLKTIEKKEKSLTLFLEGLRGKGVMNSIGKIFLFGSVARNQAKPESDIDILIIATGDPGDILERCADVAFEVVTQTGESIEPLVYTLNDYRYPSSLFLWQITRNSGKEVFGLNENELRQKEASDYLLLASHYLEGSKRNRDAGDYRLACDAAYNAAELCIKGLLLFKIPELPTSHGGLAQLFGKEYVLADPAKRHLGRRVTLALEKRNKARYDIHSDVTEADVELVISLAEELADMLAGMLK